MFDFFHGLPHIYIIAVGGQYLRIFGSRLAVQKSRIEYCLVLLDLRSTTIYLLYDPALASSLDTPGSSSVRKW